MSDPEPPSPERIAWEMLLNGWGYNWYRRDEQMRADDLLIRNRACECLHRAAARLAELEARHREAYLPPPTRLAPDADPARLAEVRAIRVLRDRIDAAEVQLRGGSMPPDDRIWGRHRNHDATLASLIEADAALISAAQAVERAAAPALSSPLSPTGLTAAASAVDALLSAAAARRALLEFRPALGAGTRFDV